MAADCADGTGSGSTLNLGNNITINSSAGTTAFGIDVGSLSGGATGVTVSFGTLANGTANVTPNQGGFMFTGNNGYIAQMKVFALAGSSGATNYMSASGNMNVVIGSPLNLSATAVYSQQATPGTGFDTVNFNGTTSGTSNGGLGNVIYGTIADSANFINQGGWLHGETNVQFNAIYSGQQARGRPQAAAPLSGPSPAAKAIMVGPTSTVARSNWAPDSPARTAISITLAYFFPTPAAVSIMGTN